MNKLSREPYRSDVLIVENQNKLTSSAVESALSREDSIHRVLVVENLDAIDVATLNSTFSIIIIFITYPISVLSSRLSRLTEKGGKIMLVLNQNDKFAFNFILKLPIDGLISTDATYAELLGAIHTIDRKNLKYMSPGLISSISSLAVRESPFSHLSKKELEVALSIMHGRRNREIANDLNISHKTVSTYKSRIFKKLEITSSAQLFSQAIKNGIEIGNS